MMVDPRHRRLSRHRQSFGKSREQTAVALVEPPIGATVLVADTVADRHQVELGAVCPAARRLEQLIPPSARFEDHRERTVLRLHCRFTARHALRLAQRNPFLLGLDGLATAAQPGRPFGRAAMHGEAEALGDRRQRVAVGRMKPFGAAIERKSGRRDRVDAPADPVARFEHQHRHPAGFQQAPCRSDPGGTGADHRDIDIGWQICHLLPRRRQYGLA